MRCRRCRSLPYRIRLSRDKIDKTGRSARSGRARCGRSGCRTRSRTTSSRLRSLRQSAPMARRSSKAATATSSARRPCSAEGRAAGPCTPWSGSVRHVRAIVFALIEQRGESVAYGDYEEIMLTAGYRDPRAGNRFFAGDPEPVLERADDEVRLTDRGRSAASFFRNWWLPRLRAGKAAWPTAERSGCSAPHEAFSVGMPFDPTAAREARCRGTAQLLIVIELTLKTTARCHRRHPLRVRSSVLPSAMERLESRRRPRWH